MTVRTPTETQPDQTQFGKPQLANQPAETRPAETGPAEAGPAEAGPAETAQAQMIRMLQAPLLTQALAVAAELEIAELLARGPKSVERLAREANADPDGLYRMLRALATAGVFSEVAPRSFASTPLAETLREGAGSLRNWARLWTIEERTAAIGALMYSVRTGKPAFPRLHGASWWDQLSDRPDQASVYAAAMGELSRELHTDAAAAYDLSEVGTLIDIGGGRGHLIATLLRRNRRLRAVLFDQPGVVRHAGPVLAEAGVTDRATVIGGDFFDNVPAGGQAYLMSMILHGWDDAQATTILTNVRQAMPAGSVLLVIDAIVPAGDLAHDGKLRDLITLALHPGRERTEAEFARLFTAAGLRLRESRRVSGSTGLLIAEPAG
ncbi:MAG: methyltransferase [Jatrophihabitantaceae bacterium]